MLDECTCERARLAYLVDVLAIVEHVRGDAKDLLEALVDICRGNEEVNHRTRKVRQIDTRRAAEGAPGRLGGDVEHIHRELIEDVPRVEDQIVAPAGQTAWQSRSRFVTDWMCGAAERARMCKAS